MTKKLLNSRFFLALGLLAFFSVSQLFVLELVQKKQEGIGKIINIAGRQRMLSQRITLLLVELENNSKEEKALNESLNASIELFRSSHQTLVRFIPNTSLLFNLEKLKKHYEEPNGLNELVEKFLNDISLIRENHNSEQLERFTAFTKKPLLKSLDQAVKYFERYSNKIVQTMRFIILSLVVVSLLALVAVYFLILAPLRDTIIENQEVLKGNEEKALGEAHFKSMFLANMSHELRTPLNGVLGVTDLLASTPLSKEQQDYLKIINQSGETLLGVVNNILDLTKLELGQVELEKKPFSPEEVFNSIEHSFKYLLISKGLDYKTELQSLPQYLIGDKLRINQILNNLVSNAIKFTNEGSVTFQACFESGNLKLKIIDSGVGMTSEQKRNVFTPFRQADSSTTRKFGGTGLGLSIVREIIVLMGGKISCDSQIGEGTTFEVNIPIEESTQAPEKVIPLNDISFEQSKILVVDDNRINLNLMIKILERMNLLAIGASSGEDAIKLIQEESFDLVFMDYHMPGLDGVETTREIKKLDHAKDIPIIALTADIQDKTRTEVLEVGMVDLLSKPIRRNELNLALKRFLQKK